MCGRYAISKTNKIRERFRIDEDELDIGNRSPFFNIAPTDAAPVVHQEDGKRRLAAYSFGLIPAWAKDQKIGVQCLNARAETVAEKPAYRTPFRKRRCLVVTDAYFEWKREGKKKQPYRVTLKSGDLFAFAGLWDAWRRPDGRDIRSFSIITTTSNGLTQEFHDRMPVILKPEDEALWLAPDVSEPRTLVPLLRPYPIEEMTMIPVSTAVNSARNKGPECAVPIQLSGQ